MPAEVANGDTSNVQVEALQPADSCQAPPLKDSQFCLMHSPEHVKEAQEGEAFRWGGSEESVR